MFRRVRTVALLLVAVGFALSFAAARGRGAGSNPGGSMPFSMKFIRAASPTVMAMGSRPQRHRVET